ncbi:hypothetical protein [Xanthomonas phage RTH11]|nr:hypothetical protein [Xanthomonas phage RTH11]
MSSKPAKKATKKVATKTTAKKAPVRSAPPKGNTAPKPDLLAAGLAQAQQRLQDLSPEEQRKQAQVLMGRLISEVSRVSAQAGFLLKTGQTQYSEVTGRLDYLDACVAMIAEALHIELPKRLPPLLDATVELLTEAEVPAGENWELQAVAHAKSHPVYGKIEVVIGVGEEARSESVERMHPAVAARLKEAFAAREAAGTLVYGYFYTVRLHMVHAGAIDESSVALADEGNSGDVQQA